MWLVIRKSDHAVVGTQAGDVRPTGWNLELFELKEWFGPEPPLHDPGEGIESYDPTLDNPAWALLAQSRVDFDALADLADSEVAWLETTIPQIATMDLEDLRAVLQRLAQENLRQIKAWRYLFRRL